MSAVEIRYFCLFGAIYATARDAYSDLWKNINGAGSWDANPLFKRVQPC